MSIEMCPKCYSTFFDPAPRERRLWWKCKQCGYEWEAVENDQQLWGVSCDD